jgi:hypothetical protein
MSKGKKKTPKADALLNAVRRLYYSAVWHADRDVDEEQLWTAVRDAAGFEPGSSPTPTEYLQDEEDRQFEEEYRELAENAEKNLDVNFSEYDNFVKDDPGLAEAGSTGTLAPPANIADDWSHTRFPRETEQVAIPNELSENCKRLAESLEFGTYSTRLSLLEDAVIKNKEGALAGLTDLAADIVTLNDSLDGLAGLSVDIVTHNEKIRTLETNLDWWAKHQLDTAQKLRSDVGRAIGLANALNTEVGDLHETIENINGKSVDTLRAEVETIRTVVDEMHTETSWWIKDAVKTEQDVRALIQELRDLANESHHDLRAEISQVKATTLCDSVAIRRMLETCEKTAATAVLDLRKSLEALDVRLTASEDFTKRVEFVASDNWREEIKMRDRMTKLEYDMMPKGRLRKWLKRKGWFQ